MKFKLYTIRRCRANEYEKLVKFFREYWGENHVFCRNKEIFEFQHGDAREGEYDFVIAVHNETDEIHAVLGYISSSRYDRGDINKPESVSGALWKVRDDIDNPEIGKLGLGVLYYLLKSFPESAYITLGLSGFSQQIYDALHFDFGLMEHYYIASKTLLNYCIADAPEVNVDSCKNREYRLKYIPEIPKEFNTYYYPHKNATYIANRYTNHPFYEYKLLGIYHGEKLASVWILREIHIEGNTCIRLVDIVGNMNGISDIEGNVHEFLDIRKAEFIDCYCHGIDKEVFYQMGFKEVRNSTVIPNYFEPFEKKNVDIHYAAYSERPVVIFKGDCDQDRPNLLEIK